MKTFEWSSRTSVNRLSRCVYLVVCIFCVIKWSRANQYLIRCGYILWILVFSCLELSATAQISAAPPSTGLNKRHGANLVIYGILCPQLNLLLTYHFSLFVNHAGQVSEDFIYSNYVGLSWKQITNSDYLQPSVKVNTTMDKLLQEDWNLQPWLADLDPR